VRIGDPNEIPDELVRQVAEANEPTVWTDDFERESIEEYPDGREYAAWHRTRTLREAREQLVRVYDVIADWVRTEDVYYLLEAAGRTAGRNKKSADTYSRATTDAAGAIGAMRSWSRDPRVPRFKEPVRDE